MKLHVKWDNLHAKLTKNPSCYLRIIFLLNFFFKYELYFASCSAMISNYFHQGHNTHKWIVYYDGEPIQLA